ncbi:MAG: hypothetical protein ACP5OZ_02585 [Candidatus Woesearchaeota archaeon]
MRNLFEVDFEVLFVEKKKKKKRAQISMEFLIIMGFAMATTIPLLLTYYEYSRNANIRIKTEQVYKIAREIADSAESVYYIGAPSKTTMRVYIPEGVDSIEINQRKIVFKVKFYGNISEISYSSNVNLSGTISSHQGIHNIEIEAKEDYVEITG